MKILVNHANTGIKMEKFMIGKQKKRNTNQVDHGHH
jgi:hypothetical protein